jgi:hypothetical protein
MSTVFQIDDEIDKLIDKFTDDLKIRIKKSVVRSEKLVLKQYITSTRKETLHVKTVEPKITDTNSKPKIYEVKKNVKIAGSPRKITNEYKY